MSLKILFDSGGLNEHPPLKNNELKLINLHTFASVSKAATHFE